MSASSFQLSELLNFGEEGPDGLAVFEALFNNSDDAIFVKNLNGIYLAINPRAARLLQKPQQEIIGRSDQQLFPEAAAEKIRQQDMQVLKSAEKIVFEGKILFSGELTALLTIKIPLFDRSGKVAGLVGIARDITDLSRKLQDYNEALRQNEEQLRLLFEGIDDAIVIHDQDGRILDCNHVACERLHYSKDEMLQMTTRDIDAPEFAQGFKHRLSQQVNTGRLRCEGVHRTKEGREIPVDIVTSVIDYKGQKAVLALARDISELKKAEAERRNLELQVQHKQKLESLGVLAGGIAHDFNNLLMGILGNADLALFQLSAESPGYREVEGIQVASRRAAELCQQLLAYSGKGHFIVEPTNLNDILREMKHLLEVTIAKKVTLSYDLEDEIPAVEADRTQIRQVIMNLIRNAADAIGNNPGQIVISSGSAFFDKRALSQFFASSQLREGQYVTVKVSDSGRGMEKAVLDRIFEPFFSTKQTGKGLGLSAVLGIMRGHHGAISVESEPGAGTVITLLFPASAAAALPIEQSRVAGKWKGHGLVLLADDEAVAREVSMSMLEKIGFKVVAAQDGQAAIELFRQNAEKLVCVILDISMPRLSGQEALREILKIDPKMPAILCSGYSESGIAEDLILPEKVAFIQKPYQLESLRAKLQEVVES